MGKTAMKIIASPIYAGKSGNQFLRKVFKLYLPNTFFLKNLGSYATDRAHPRFGVSLSRTARMPARTGTGRA